MKNLLSIYYRQPGICYRCTKVQEGASRNHQLIVNPFCVIVNPPAPESSDNHPTLFANHPILSPESSDYLPTFSGYLPIRSFSLQPLAFSLPVNYPKRLIEVDLPIKRISAHARREKSIRHGHISTLHIWRARRPLAACRALICAALWPDPADQAILDWQPIVKVEHYRLKQDSIKHPVELKEDPVPYRTEGKQ